MQKTIANIVVAAAFSLLWTPSALAQSVPAPPDFPSTSYVLMDQQSGQLLASANPEKRVEPASITKMMTVYIAFDEIRNGDLSLNDKVTISENAWRMDGSKMFVEVDEQVTVNKLLHGIVTSSGNDASVALAEHIAGSESGFAQYMNQYAKQMGLENAQFKNATGWPADGHYMSAHDMARLSSHLIGDFPELYEKYFEVKKFTFNEITQYNRNSLLWTDESVDGIKTGHTEAAGYGLAAAAKRDGMRLISVVTGTGSNNARSSASQSLLNYGFRFFQTYKIFDAGHSVAQATIWKGASDQVALVADGAVHVTAPRDNREALSTSAKLPSRIVAPIEKGEKLGTLRVAYQGKTMQETPLYASEAVPAAGIIGRVIDELWLLFE